MDDKQSVSLEKYVGKAAWVRITCACALLLCAICTCALAGCSEADGSSTDLMDSVSREHVATVDIATEVPVTSETLNEFGINLLKHVDDGTDNVSVSPLSVASALGMTANGAEGDTLFQMQDVLGADSLSINQYLDELREKLTTNVANTADSDSSEQAGETDEMTEGLHIANSLWIKDGFDVEDTFLELNAGYYDAGIFQTPFNQTTTSDINKWVSENTDDMIEKIVDELPDSTVMCLINALAFKGTWADPYESDDVSPDTFTTDDGVAQEVDFMSSDEDLYLEGDGLTGFVKPYAQGSFAFAALLPDENTSVDELIDELDGATLTQLLGDAQDELVSTSMPKFESDFEITLNDALQDMGMTDAFGSQADFTGISAEGGLCIDSILHKTYVNVDEEGTEAAAATSSNIAVTSLPPTPEKTVILDRPFVYVIFDQETDAVLFVGTIRDLE